jgi:hypothetical protein
LLITACERLHDVMLSNIADIARDARGRISPSLAGSAAPAHELSHHHH